MSRYLANENFPAETVFWLRERGDDVAHVAETMAGARDLDLLSLARRENRIILTFDRIYGELIFHQRQEPALGIGSSGFDNHRRPSSCRSCSRSSTRRRCSKGSSPSRLPGTFDKRRCSN